MFRVIQKRTGRIQGYYNPKNTVKHLSEIVLFIIFIVGFIIGVWTIKNCNAEILRRLMIFFENYVTIKKSQSIIVNFLNSTFKLMILLLVIYMLSLCAVGVPIIYSIPFGYGTILGFVSGYLYKEYALKGIGYCALLIYPFAILTALIMIYSCAKGIKMSGDILKILLDETKTAETFRTFNIKYLMLAIISAVAALIDAILQVLFSGYFQFS